MNKTEKKHLIESIEAYLEDENNTINKNKIKNIKYNLGFTSGIFHERSIRKSLKILKNAVNKNQNEIKNDKQNGLYHARFKNPDTLFNDKDDVFSMDCQNSPFCMKHRRYSEKYSNYKYHYCCKYNNKFCIKDNYEKIKWVSNKFVCFNCRKICKRYKNNKKDNIYNNWPKCNECHKHMESVGVEFTPPGKNDKKHWDKLNKEWYKYSRMTYEEYKYSLT